MIILLLTVYEKTIKIILFNLITVNVELFWRTLISKAIEYGANRRYLSKENLKEQCKPYLEKNKESNTEFVNSFFVVLPDFIWLTSR